MPDCKPFSLLCTKNFLALAGAFLVTIAQGGAAYPGDCAECSVRRMSVVPGGEGYPPARARRALFPAALAIPAPGRGPSQTPKFLSPGPPSPWLPALLIWSRFLSFLRRTAGSLSPGTCTAGTVSAVSSLIPGCRGRSPRRNKPKISPFPGGEGGAGGWGQESKLKAGLVGDCPPAPPTGHHSGRSSRQRRKQAPPPGAWFASLFQCRPGSAPGDARGEAPCIRKPKISPFPGGEGG